MENQLNAHEKINEKFVQNDKLPNCLIFSSSIPDLQCAGNIQFHRLFKSYPAEKLLVIGPQSDESTRLQCVYRVYGNIILRLYRTRFAYLLRSLQCLFPLHRLGMGYFGAELNAFKPEVIVTAMESMYFFTKATHLANKLGIPLVLIVHDINEDFEPVYKWAESNKRQIHTNSYQMAMKRLCISPELVTYLADRYGAEGSILYPLAKDELQPRLPEESKRLKKEGIITIGYAGSTNYGYKTTLLALAPHLAKHNIELHIFTKSLSEEFIIATQKWPNLIWRGFSTTPETPIQNDCDAVLLPYQNPAGELHRLYSTHFPSKMVDYLAMGMPIIIYGPEVATGVRWGLQYSDTFVVSHQLDITDLLVKIESLRTNDSRRVELSANSARHYQQHFSNSKTVATLHESIRQATEA